MEIYLSNRTTTGPYKYMYSSDSAAALFDPVPAASMGWNITGLLKGCPLRSSIA